MSTIIEIYNSSSCGTPLEGFSSQTDTLCESRASSSDVWRWYRKLLVPSSRMAVVSIQTTERSSNVENASRHRKYFVQQMQTLQSVMVTAFRVMGVSNKAIGCVYCKGLI
jgi:hypothetical protein